MSGKPRLDSRWADCEDWPKGRNAAGYGIRSFRGVSWLAHRVAWVLANGEIPAGLQVAHHCDNPPCVNIFHLYLATNAQNQADKAARGRGATGDKRGQHNSIARLTDESVREIRRLYATGDYTQKSIGERFGVTQSTVHFVAKRKTWHHIEDAA